MEFELFRAWEGQTPAWYKRAYRAKPRLFEKVVEWVECADVLEVGGGLGFLAKYSARYTNIEACETACLEGAQLHDGYFINNDFMVLGSDMVDYRPEYLVALAVLEHQPDPVPFLRHCAEFKPDAIIFSLFMGWYHKDTTHLKPRNGRPVWFNRYSRPTIHGCLRTIGYGKIEETHVDRCELVKAERSA